MQQAEGGQAAGEGLGRSKSAPLPPATAPLPQAEGSDAAAKDTSIRASRRVTRNPAWLGGHEAGAKGQQAEQ